MRASRRILCLSIGLSCIGGLPLALASKGRSDTDRILSSYSKSKTLKDWVTAEDADLTAVDKFYLNTLFRRYPSLNKPEKLPAITFERSTFSFREGPASLQFKWSPNIYHNAAVNDQELQLHPLMRPTEKMKALQAALAAKKTTSFLVMPSAFAAGGGEPTRMGVVAYSLSARQTEAARQMQRGLAKHSQDILDLLFPKSREGSCGASLKTLVQTLSDVSLADASFHCSGSGEKAILRIMYAKEVDGISSLELKPESLALVRRLANGKLQTESYQRGDIQQDWNVPSDLEASFVEGNVKASGRQVQARPADIIQELSRYTKKNSTLTDMDYERLLTYLPVVSSDEIRGICHRGCRADLERYNQQQRQDAMPAVQ